MKFLNYLKEINVDVTILSDIHVLIQKVFHSDI